MNITIKIDEANKDVYTIMVNHENGIKTSYDLTYRELYHLNTTITNIVNQIENNYNN